VLIADDEPDVLTFCETALKKGKYNIITAANGPDAMEMIEKEKPDLAVLDIMLPGMDGYTIQMKMAQNEQLRKIPVIVISALKPAEALFIKFEQVLKFLQKPFNANDFYALVEQALDENNKNKKIK